MSTAGLRIIGPGHPEAGRILSPEALSFVAGLHERFDTRRRALLAARRIRAAEKTPLGLRADTAYIRDDPDWRVRPAPAPLQDRRVEITGPVDAKMMINALNSGAQVYMADFEDSHAPTWAGTVQGQANLMDAVQGNLTYYDVVRDRDYRIRPGPAVLCIRPRGLHLDELHVDTGGAPLAASFFDYGLAVYHNANNQLARGQGPYFYLPKLEGHHEARLWADVFAYTEERLGLDPGTIKATVLIETLPAAFEAEEILYELRDHCVGLNAGRWDYIFSCIKTYAHDAGKVLPDRAQVTMEVPFMRAYARRLIDVCHRRGAHAMGGMSAFVPNGDARRTHAALDAVRADKEREVAEGHDGTWVAHPALVDVALAAFKARLGDRPNQLDAFPPEVPPPEAMLDFAVPAGKVSEQGLRDNIDVALRYMTAWLSGRGAVALRSLMEDAATAEISRGQVWQWRHHAVKMDDGRVVTRELVQQYLEASSDELARESTDAPVRPAQRLLHDVLHADRMPDFLTPAAYRKLTEATVGAVQVGTA